MYHTCIEIDPFELKEAARLTRSPEDPNDADGGLITAIWGPPEWESFHAKTFGYPVKPTQQQKEEYKQYFEALGNVLPCEYCRKSYKKFISEGDTKLDMNVMESRETLTKWGWRVHNRVNEKLGVDYGETYEEMCYKYESFRAKCIKGAKGCTMPLNMKAKSYQKAAIRRAPIIDKKYSIALINHAKNIGMNNYESYLSYYSSLVRNSKEWTERDCLARKVIDYMRKSGLSSLDKNGMPSIHEMALISMLSSTLEKTKLDEIYNKINSNS